MKRQAKTLLTRTWLTVAAAVLLFLLFTSIMMFYYLLQPLARQSADDLAGLIVLSAQVWVELPPETRPDFELELNQNHGLTIAVDSDEQLQPHPLNTPYMRYLEAALAERLELSIAIQSYMSEELWLWMDIPMASHSLRFSLPHSRVGAKPPLVALWLLAGALVATLLASLFLVRKLNQPIKNLTSAAESLGQGSKLAPLPEEGPREIVTLTRRFNEMMQQIHVLLQNRTVLLAGISHDLRTPIARIRLAIEMLQPDQDQKLLDRIKNDLVEMDALIGRTLEFAKGLDAAHKESEQEIIVISELIQSIVNSHEPAGADFDLNGAKVCTVHANQLALKRVLDNLIENALRYSQQQTISIEWKCSESEARINILDRGPGIPDEHKQLVFQPFHRLEGSRNRSTGGSGLGLAIVDQLCTAHGWRIELQSRQQGGTSAGLLIPR